jgi:signal transduction histidine kinase
MTTVISVCIFSPNHQLAEHCHAVLDELCPEQYEIQHCSPSVTADKSCICIWDAENVQQLPACMENPGAGTRLIVVSKRTLPLLKSELPHQDFVFLHSPVTRLGMRVFLESTVVRMQLNRDRNSPAVALDQDRILQKLLETNLKLQDDDRDRTNFFTRAIHDLRVPLMATEGYCGLLLDGQMGRITSEQARILEKMQRSLTRLGGLATAMMELGVGSSPRARLKLENASFDACVDQAVHEILPIAEQKRITVTVDIEPPEGVLLFDPGQMEQVIVNLLDNGCKFTPRKGAITIHGYSITRDESPNAVWANISSGYRLDVRDTGPGIAPEHIGRVFDEFTSYSGSSDRSGTGLGLAICRMIIDAHNGHIWAESEERGARFSLILPYVRAYVRAGNIQRVMQAAV